MDEITSVKINELPSGDVAAENLFIFGVGDKMYTDLISSLVALVPTTTVGVKASLSDYNVTVLEADLTSFLNTINLTIAAGDVKFIRFFLIDSQMYLSRMTYAVPLSNGTYNPLGSSLDFSDLIMINKEYMMPNADANTVTYSFDSIAEINTSNPAIDLSDSLLTYILIISDVSYLFIGINGVYGDGELQIEETDLSLINTGPQFNLKVYESGETPIENINEIAFSGATVTDDGSGKVTVTITGGGVTKFTELTDVPASYTGQGSKVVAVKVDESGLEFVAGGGIPDAPNDTFGYIRKALAWTKSTLSEALNGGKTATFTGADDVLTEIDLGEYNEMDLESPISFRQSRIFENIDIIQTFIQKLGITLFQSNYFNTLTEIGKVSSFNLDNGDFSFQKQNQYPTKIANQNIEVEDIAEVDIPIDGLDVIFKPKPKFVSGTYYLVDEDYVTNAIAGVTTPDATPTVKGIAKLYTSLGSNTDGAVDQNTVNTEISKLTLPLISDTPAISITGVNVPTIMTSYLITGGLLSNYNRLISQIQVSKSGTASSSNLLYYINTSNSISGATPIATSLIANTNQFAPLDRKYSLSGTTITGYPFGASATTDSQNSSSARGSATYNRANNLYFIIAINPGSISDTHTLETVEINARRIKTTI